MKFKFDFKKIFGAAADRLFALGLTSPQTFSGAVRPILLGHSDGDIVKANALAMQGMTDHIHVIEQHSASFLQELNDKLNLASLRVNVAGKPTIPIGTAAGLDPDAHGLTPLSMLFGFQVPGPVTLQPRRFEKTPFQENRRRADLYVPTELANCGLVEFRDHLRSYREKGGEAIILPAVAGLPNGSDAQQTAIREMETILESLEPFADGFIWYPLNAQSCGLTTPQHFQEVGSLMRARVGEKLKLVAMTSYEPDQRDGWLSSVDAFLDAGGDGLVAVVGRVVSRDEVPHPEKWPYETALHCGASMAAYRQRAIEDARRSFSHAFIAACGGFHNRDEAFRACEYANVIMENEAFTRFGPGIARTLLFKLVLRLNCLQRHGTIATADLQTYQQSRWNPHDS